MRLNQFSITCLHCLYVQKMRSNFFLISHPNSYLYGIPTALGTQPKKNACQGFLNHLLIACLQGLSSAYRWQCFRITIWINMHWLSDRNSCRKCNTFGLLATTCTRAFTCTFFCLWTFSFLSSCLVTLEQCRKKSKNPTELVTRKPYHKSGHIWVSQVNRDWKPTQTSATSSWIGDCLRYQDPACAGCTKIERLSKKWVRAAELRSVTGPRLERASLGNNHKERHLMNNITGLKYGQDLNPHFLQDPKDP